MRIRASKTLVFQPEDGHLIACNFLTKKVFACSYDLLDFLKRVSRWSTPNQVQRRVSGYSRAEIRETIDALLEMSVVVAEGDDLATREEEFERHWRWGLPAALMHFCVQDPEFMTLEQAEDHQRARLSSEGAMALYTPNLGDCVQRLPNARGINPLLSLMEKRRTRRQGCEQAISLQALSECLFAGLGITGETQNCVGKLPLSMTPSGGARNPYEAYVLARNVDGLAAGIYHYSAIDHTLDCIAPDAPPSFAALVGGQEWADTMPCLIVLCAQMDRTMWKYADANAYRVVMIEAGHIGQNVMLAATQNGLTACPTAALRHSWIASLLGLRNPTHAAIYALTLGYPAEEQHNGMDRP